MEIKQLIMKMTGAVMIVSGIPAWGAAESTTIETSERTTEITTSRVITRTVIKEKVKWTPFKVCVLDFTTVETEGQKRFLDQNNRPIVIPPQCTLNDLDRKTVNDVMQGYVRMIDARSNRRTADANREAQIDDNEFTRSKALEIYRNTLNGPTRPVIIGAQYLSAYLGKRSDVFSCMDPSLMSAAMVKLRNAPDFPRDFMLRLAKETGATHLIYGTVSDLRVRRKSFQGYGIKTSTLNYQLDVIVKMVDLIRQSTVYSNVYTGNYREQRPVSNTQFDNNIFQTLMTAALEQAAEDLYEKCKPGRGNMISVTPMPYTVIVNPVGDKDLKAELAQIFVNGTLAGNGGSALLIPAGKYQFTVKAAGYADRNFDFEVGRDSSLRVMLDKTEKTTRSPKQ